MSVVLYRRAGSVEPQETSPKGIRLWVWGLLLLPVFLGAGGFWFFSGTVAGQRLWLDYQYRHLGSPERLPVSKTARPLPGTGCGAVVHIRRDGRCLIVADGLPANPEKLQDYLRLEALKTTGPDGRAALALRILADRRARATEVSDLIQVARNCGIWRFQLAAISSKPPPSAERRLAVIDVCYPPGADKFTTISPESRMTVQELVDALDRALQAGATQLVIGRAAGSE